MKLKPILRFAVLCICALPVSLLCQGGGSVVRQIISPPIPTGTGQPAPFTPFRVCTGTATGVPCNPLTTAIYSDQALTHPISNPGTSDGNGLYSFFVPTATYLVQESPIPGVTYSYLVFVTTSTVSSVGLNVGGPLFTVLNSPITTSGTISLILNQQSANRVFANCSAFSTQPSFCPLTAAMLPAVISPTTLNVSGNAIIGGTLGVTGNTTLSGALGITGLFTGSNELLSGTLGVTGLSTLGAVNMAGPNTINGNTVMGGPVTMNGVETFAGTSNFTGPATFTGAATFNGTLSIASLTVPIINAGGSNPLTLTAGSASLFPGSGQDVVLVGGPPSFTGIGGGVTLNGAANCTGGSCLGGSYFQGSLKTNTFFSSYNSISTVCQGMPAEYASQYVLNQSANVSSTLLYNVPASTASRICPYRIGCYIIVVTRDAVSSTLPTCTVSYTDAFNSVVQALNVTATSTGNSTTTFQQNYVKINPKVSTAINYSTTGYVSNTPGAMVYSFVLTMEAL